MNIIKKFKKGEKGSITMMVLTAMMFMLIVIGTSYFAISNKSIEQNKKISQISNEYRATQEDMDQEYRNVFDNIDLTINQSQSDDMFERTINTITTDINGNKIVIPAGFKVTEDTTDVTKGIVIEDKDGNQFVWIPVGEIYTDVEQTELNKKTIKLGRYEFTEDGTPNEYIGEEYTEDTLEDHNSGYENAIAKDIKRFITSAKRNHGYYLGRYEAGVEGYDSSITTTNDNLETNWTGYAGDNINLVCKSGQQVWNHVTQNKASELSRNMYTSSNFTSDLVNSYAWDTAIVFIQEFSGYSDYSKQTRIQTTLASTGEATNGTYKDVRCNIYDMAGNTLEWSTETQTDDTYYCVSRGGVYNNNDKYSSYRSYLGTATSSYEDLSFRPILYVQ